VDFVDGVLVGWIFGCFFMIGIQYYIERMVDKMMKSKGGEE
jgi:hypothetical protein